jgi:epoxyqueuosine reductase
MVDFRPASVEAAAPSLIPLLSLTEEQVRLRFAGRPVMRAKRDGLLRNACIALGNRGDERAIPALTAALSDPAPLVRGHAAWALGRLGARAPLDNARHREQDACVRDEIEAALAGEDAGIAVPAQQPLHEWLAGSPWHPSPGPSPR